MNNGHHQQSYDAFRYQKQTIYFTTEHQQQYPRQPTTGFVLIIYASLINSYKFFLQKSKISM